MGCGGFQNWSGSILFECSFVEVRPEGAGIEISLNLWTSCGTTWLSSLIVYFCSELFPVKPAVTCRPKGSASAVVSWTSVSVVREPRCALWVMLFAVNSVTVAVDHCSSHMMLFSWLRPLITVRRGLIALITFQRTLCSSSWGNICSAWSFVSLFVYTDQTTWLCFPGKLMHMCNTCSPSCFLSIYWSTCTGCILLAAHLSFPTKCWGACVFDTTVTNSF